MGGFLNTALSALGMGGTDNQPPQQPGQIPSVYVPPPPQSQQTLELPQVYQPQPPPSQQTAEIPQAHTPAGNRPPPPPGGTIAFTPRRELLQAMGQQESGGVQDPRLARGKAGEFGRMQVLPQTAAMYGVTPEQLKANPALSDSVGERYFTDLLRRYHGNEFLALVAYNSGPGRVDRGQLLPQSVKYATAILKRAPTGVAGATAQGPQLTPPGPQSTPSMTAMLQQAAPPSPGQAPPQQPSGDQQGPLQQAIRQQADLYPYQQMIDPTGAVDPTAAAMMAAQGGGAPQQAQAAPTQPLQQMLAGQGPETKYGPLGAAPVEADIAGEGYSPREVRGMEPFAMGAVGGVEGEVPELSGAARAMVRRARAFGIDPEQIGPLAQRVREGTLTERGLSQSLMNLRKQLPQTAKTAAMIRGAAEDIPRDVLGAISRAVREGDLTAQQAKKMLKAVTGGAALLPLIGAERQAATPSTPQPGGVGQVPLQVQQQPGFLQRMGQSLGGALGATPAYAGEGEDFNARYFGGGAPSGGQPQPPPTIPGAGYTGVNAAGQPVMTMGQPGPASGVSPTDIPRTSTSVSINVPGVGRVSKTTATTPPSAAERQQIDTAIFVLGQAQDALDFYDQKIQPRIDRHEFSGDITSKSGWKTFWAPYEATHSRVFQAIPGVGDQPGDPDLNDLYDKLGPITAEQLKAQTGGRVGVGIAEFLGPHLPKIPEDNPWRIHQKLVDLRHNVPIIVREYMRLHQNPNLSDDDIDQRIRQLVPTLPWRTQAGPPHAAPNFAPRMEQATPTATPTPGGGAQWHSAPGSPPPPGTHGASDWKRLSSGKWASPSTGAAIVQNPDGSWD